MARCLLREKNLLRRGFAIKIRIDHELQSSGDRTQMAEILGGTQDVCRLERFTPAQVLRVGHVPLSFGSRVARGTPPGVHRIRYLRPLQTPQGFQCAASHGIRCVRVAGRAVRHPDRAASGDHYPAEHRALPFAAGPDRAFVRLGSRGAHLRPGVLPLDTVDLYAVVQFVVR